MYLITEELIQEIKNSIVSVVRILYKKDNKPQRTQSSKKKIFATSVLSALSKSAFICVHLRLNESNPINNVYSKKWGEINL